MSSPSLARAFVYGLLLATDASAQRAATAPTAEPTNVVVIVADDLGIDAVGFYEAILGTSWALASCGFSPPVPCPPEVQLPNIARLQEHGVLFTEAWATPTCSPTRATILTGRYGFRYGIGGPIQPCASGCEQGTSLPDTEVLLPEVLGSEFARGAFGKWHVTSTPDSSVTCTTAGAPWKNGFEVFQGQFQPVNALYCDPAGGPVPWSEILGAGNGLRCSALSRGVAPSSCCLVTEQVQDAIDWIASSYGGGRRLFCYLTPQSPYEHAQWPVSTATCRTVPAGRGCTTATGTELLAAYGARLESLDREIGRVLDTLDELAGPDQRWWHTTTVLFLGDNGSPTNVARAPFGSSKSKGALHEGGLRVPFVVSGAAVAPPRRGAISDELVNTVDVFATVIALAGRAPPSGVRIDGVDLTPYLKTNPPSGLRSFSFAEQWTNVPNNTSTTCYPGSGTSTPDRVVRARIRGEDWKLFFSDDGVVANDVLFDLGADPCENVPLSPLLHPEEYVQLVGYVRKVVASCP
jgi:arylsulfatase A-like enzyme